MTPVFSPLLASALVIAGFSLILVDHKWIGTGLITLAMIYAAVDTLLTIRSQRMDEHDAAFDQEYADLIREANEREP